MSYITKKTKVFNNQRTKNVARIRSEGRMKLYQSAADPRAWCIDIDDRRRQILEYEARNKDGYCKGRILPLDVIINALIACKDGHIRSLEQELEYLEKLLQAYSKLKLTNKQKDALNKLVKDLDDKYIDTGSDFGDELTFDGKISGTGLGAGLGGGKGAGKTGKKGGKVAGGIDDGGRGGGGKGLKGRDELGKYAGGKGVGGKVAGGIIGGETGADGIGKDLKGSPSASKPDGGTGPGKRPGDNDQFEVGEAEEFEFIIKGEAEPGGLTAVPFRNGDKDKQDRSPGLPGVVSAIKDETGLSGRDGEVSIKGIPSGIKSEAGVSGREGEASLKGISSGIKKAGEMVPDQGNKFELDGTLREVKSQQSAKGNLEGLSDIDLEEELKIVDGTVQPPKGYFIPKDSSGTVKDKDGTTQMKSSQADINIPKGYYIGQDPSKICRAPCALPGPSDLRKDHTTCKAPCAQKQKEICRQDESEKKLNKDDNICTAPCSKKLLNKEIDDMNKILSSVPAVKPKCEASCAKMDKKGGKSESPKKTDKKNECTASCSLAATEIKILQEQISKAVAAARQESPMELLYKQPEFIENSTQATKVFFAQELNQTDGEIPEVTKEEKCPVGQEGPVIEEIYSNKAVHSNVSSSTAFTDEDPKMKLDNLIEMEFEKVINGKRKISDLLFQKLEKLQNIVQERDYFKNKLQVALSEVEFLKNGSIGESGLLDTLSLKRNPSATSCEFEIDSLEREIEDMRKQQIKSPDFEAQLIRKELDVLKKYCTKLSVIQDENKKIKIQMENTGKMLKDLGIPYSTDEDVENLKKNLLKLKETIAERDELRKRITELEAELCTVCNNMESPEDIEMYKKRSFLLDEVIKDRDRLSKRVESLRGIEEEVKTLRRKSGRVDELERQLKNHKEENSCNQTEIKSLRCQCLDMETEIETYKAETKSLRSKLVCVNHELEGLKCICNEQEQIKEERDELERDVKELRRIQVEHDNMCSQLKTFNTVLADRDMYKKKYEALCPLEYDCQILRAQLEYAKEIEADRDNLRREVCNLEKTIAGQEEEIKKLCADIDCLATGRDEQQDKIKTVMSKMRAELEQKDFIIHSSEEKIAQVQVELKESIEGVCSETTSLRNKNEQLVKEINSQKSALECLQQEVNKHQKLTKEQCNCINELKQALELSKIENQKLQEIALNVNMISGDKHFQEMVKQSKCAVQRIAEELRKQYEEWDCMKEQMKKDTTCPCKIQNICRCANEQENFEESDESTSQKDESSDSKEEFTPPCICCKCNQVEADAEDHVSEEVVDEEDEDWKNWDCNKGQDWRNWDCKKEGEQKGDHEECNRIIEKLQSELEKALREKVELENRLTESHEELKITQKEVEVVDRLGLENEALRRHSTEVQDVAKAQIEELVEHLKQSKDKIGQLEAELAALKAQLQSESELRAALENKLIDLESHGDSKEVEDLRKELEKLKKEKSNLESMLNSAIAASSKRSSKMELELAALQSKHSDGDKIRKELEVKLNDLTNKNNALSLQKQACEKENDILQKALADLQKELDKLKESSVSKQLFDELNKEKESLLKKIADNQKEIGILLEKTKQTTEKPVSPTVQQFENDRKEKEALQSIIDDLQKQLKNLPVPEKLEPSKELTDKINELTKRLQEEQRRADAAEEALKKMKQSDRTNMLQDELSEIKKRLAELEKENNNLKQSLSQSEQKFNDLKRQLDSALGENKKMKDDNEKLQNTINNLQTENVNLKKDIQNAQNEIKQKSQQVSDKDKLESESAKLRSEKERYEKEAKSNAEQISNLQSENTKLKDNLNKLQTENAAMKKSLDAALNETKKHMDKITQLESENSKQQQQIASLENEIAKLKKELENMKNESSKGSSEATKLQNEIADLKKKLAQLEQDNGKLKKDLDSALNDNKENLKKLLQAEDDNKKHKQRISDLEKECEKLKKDLEGVKGDSKKESDALAQNQKELDALKANLLKLEAENGQLKKDMNSYLDREKKLLEQQEGDAHLKKQLTDLQKEKGQGDAEIKELKDKLKAAEAEKAKVSKLENENDALKKRIAELENQLKKLESDVGGLQDQLKKSQAENSSLKKQKDEDNKALKDKLAAMEKQHAELENKNKLLAAETDKLKTGDGDDIKNMYNQRIKDLEAQLASQKKECGDTIASLKQQFDRDMKDLMNKNGRSIDKIQRTSENAIKDISNTFERDIKALQDQLKQAKTALATCENENKKLKQLLAQKQQQIVRDSKDEGQQIDLMPMTAEGTIIKEEIPVTGEINGPKVDRPPEEIPEKLCQCGKPIKQILDKIIAKGFKALKFEELQMLHESIADAVNLFEKSKNIKKLRQLKKLDVLESGIIKQEEKAHAKVVELQMIVDLQKAKLEATKHSLKEEQKKNEELKAKLRDQARLDSPILRVPELSIPTLAQLKQEQLKTKQLQEAYEVEKLKTEHMRKLLDETKQRITRKYTQSGSTLSQDPKPSPKRFFTDISKLKVSSDYRGKSKRDGLN